MKEYPKCVVYKVSEQFKYYFDDNDAIEIQRGLTWYEAITLIKNLERSPDIPKNPSGLPKSLYKYCSEEEWDNTQFKLC